MNFSMMHLPGGLHISFDGAPMHVSATDKMYPAVVQAIKDRMAPEALRDLIEAEKKRLESATELTPDISVADGIVRYKGQPVNRVLSERMVTMLEEGFDLSPMNAFLHNLMDNTDAELCEELYPFLEIGKLTLTEDGCFLAYKAVRENFRDIYTGKIDNSVGEIVTMDRNRVDPDRRRTCSFGLHVCSFDYLPHFSNANGHVMVCKVNPRDVVSIPDDYNYTKMRVCRYEVVGEVTDYYAKNDNILSAATVAADNPFIVEVDYDDGDGYCDHSQFARLSDAAAEWEDVVEGVEDGDGDSDIVAVRLRNRMTDQVLQERKFNVTTHVEVKYQIVGFTLGSDEPELFDGEYDTVGDAVSEALDHDGYDRIEIRDLDGTVHKTLS